ncbi:MAG TPA: hypothetical protein VFW87_08755 [Pirellulales bacterium]|nr:hypothetical protein [Pirellulales bacterium]
MSGRTTRLWCAAVVAGGLLTAAPGCYIRRGFALQWNWSLHAHRYRCNGPPCGAEPPAMVADDAECVDCATEGGGHNLANGRAAEGPPPLAPELSPDPEPAGPSYFHPLPTRPVFGPRSEQPDAIEGQSLLPVPTPSHGAEPLLPLLPPPAAKESDEAERADDGPVEQDSGDGGPDADSSTELRRLPAERDAQTSGWKAAKKGQAPKRIRSTSGGQKPLASASAKSAGATKSLPCPHCSVTFKPKPRTTTASDD